MNKPYFSSEVMTSILDMLAIVECATAVTIAYLLGLPTANDLQNALENHVQIKKQDELFCLMPTVAAARLRHLALNDEPHFRLLHQQTIEKLGARFMAGDEAIEPTLILVYKRLANHLLTTIDTDFYTLIAASHSWLLKGVVNKQWRRYFAGVVLFQQEHYDNAMHLFEALLADPELDLHVRGRTLNSRAIGFRIRGQLEAALDGYQQCLTIWRTLGDEFNIAKALTNMGASAYFLRRYGQASQWLHEAIIIYEQGDFAIHVGIAKNQLGLISRDLGHWDEASAYFQAYIHCGETVNNADIVGTGLLNVGEILLFQGRMEEALVVLERALTKMTRQVYRIDVYLHIGLAYLAQQKLTPAQEVLQQALHLAQEIGRHEVLPHVYYLLGLACYEQEDVDGALTHYLAAVTAIENSRQPMRDEGIKISLLGLWQQVYEALVLFWFAQGDSSEAFTWSERARARAFAEAIGGDSVPEREISMTTAVAIQNALPPNSNFLSYFTSGVLEHDLPMLKAIAGDNPLRRHLLTEPKVILFVIKPHTIQAIDCAIDPNMFTMTSLRGNDPRRFLSTQILSRLSASLLSPATSALNGEKLYLAAHGPLHNVPFGALADDNNRPLLRQDGPAVVHTPSGIVLWQQRQPLIATQIGSMPGLALGYNGQRNGRFLRYTEIEAQLVAQMIGGEAWIGGQADKSLLQQTVVKQRLLHFACHGWFNQDEPLASALEIGPDCTLTAREIIEDWHLAADLVVLSACQTGVSRVLRSDEPMGLIRAFMTAGATAVLVTHWPVEDLPTFLLMVHFYQLLLQEGKAPAKALRDAQVWLRELTVTDCALFITTLPRKPTGWRSDLSLFTSTDPPFAAPQHWAAFTLYGK